MAHKQKFIKAFFEAEKKKPGANKGRLETFEKYFQMGIAIIEKSDYTEALKHATGAYTYFTKNTPHQLTAENCVPFATRLGMIHGFMQRFFESNILSDKQAFQATLTVYNSTPPPFDYLLGIFIHEGYAHLSETHTVPETLRVFIQVYNKKTAEYKKYNNANAA